MSILSDKIYVTYYEVYDDASADKSSRYTFYANPNNSSVTYQGGYYQINYPSRTPEQSPVKLALGEFTGTDFEINIDVYYTASSTKQCTLQVVADNVGNWDNHSECGTWSGSKTCGSVFNGTNYRTNPLGALSTSTWYTFKIKRTGNTILCQIYNGNSLVVEKSSTAWTSSTIIPYLQLSEYISLVRFKNLKITL